MPTSTGHDDQALAYLFVPCARLRAPNEWHNVPIETMLQSPGFHYATSSHPRSALSSGWREWMGGGDGHSATCRQQP